MPKYYKEHARGYDLDRELPFADIDGLRVQLGSAGSIIMICQQCGEEHFRERISESECCFQGHGKMVPATFELVDKLRPMLEAQGIEFTTIEERRKD